MEKFIKWFLFGLILLGIITTCYNILVKREASTGKTRNIHSSMPADSGLLQPSAIEVMHVYPWMLHHEGVSDRFKQAMLDSLAMMK